MTLSTRTPNQTVSINPVGIATHRRESTGAITLLTPALSITIPKAGTLIALELFRGFDLLSIDPDTGDQTEIEPIGYLSNAEFRLLNSMIEDGTLEGKSWEDIDAMIITMRKESEPPTEENPDV